MFPGCRILSQDLCHENIIACFASRAFLCVHPVDCPVEVLCHLSTRPFSRWPILFWSVVSSDRRVLARSSCTGMSRVAGGSALISTIRSEIALNVGKASAGRSSPAAFTICCTASKMYVKTGAALLRSSAQARVLPTCTITMLTGYLGERPRSRSVRLTSGLPLKSCIANLGNVFVSIGDSYIAL